MEHEGGGLSGLETGKHKTGTGLPSLNQGKCLSRGEHRVSLRSVRGIFIPSSIQEELNKKQSVRASRIVTRSLER